jgi:hypothetical protein
MARHAARYELEIMCIGGDQGLAAVLKRVWRRELWRGPCSSGGWQGE